ncbi:MAG: hypothetical protein GWN93_26970 [Deltaproteobacteria bacterium]|nr:hypothetical protein [Deltaproteobacteria bacterium]
MTKHTPGPWKLRSTPNRTYDDGYREYPFIVYSECCSDLPGRGICDVLYQEKNRQDVTGANARLIAAAPDLLEAAEELWDHYIWDHYNGYAAMPPGGDFHEKYSNLKLAINKAKGGRDENL